jgi:outer membrane protein assembly factor BamB
MVNLIEKGVPDKLDPSGGSLLWKVEHGLGGFYHHQLSADTIISRGKVFVGSNNSVPHSKRDIDKNGESLDLGVLLCLDEKTGKFLWQSVHPKLPSGGVNDWPRVGICSSPAVEEDRVYFVSNRCTMVCADGNGQESKQPGIQRDGFSDTSDAKFLWEYDMIGELGVCPRERSVCSPLIVDDLLFVITANGVDETLLKVAAPDAPSFIALNKKTGKLVWKSNAPGEAILHGQWSNAAFGEIYGVRQVIFPGGDGWLYSFVPETGELIWKFDCNQKDAGDVVPGVGTRNYFLGTPVIYDNRVYIGTGQDPERGGATANFFCIAPTMKGDISKTVISGRDKDGKPLNEKENPNSCEVWRYGGPETRKWAQFGYKFGRTVSTACIVDDIVYIPELAGFLHCLNAKTGEHYWKYDTRSTIRGSAYYVDGKVFLANDNGEVFVFRHLKEHKVYDDVKAAVTASDEKEARKLRKGVSKQVEEKYLISRNEFDDCITHNLVVANGVLYVKTGKMLYAFKCDK